jgi:Flp pilus assembly protein TadG
MQRLTELLSRFRKDENGAFMVLFAVLAIVLIAVSGSVVDFTYTQTARTRAQTALDSAALALQTRISIDSNATLKSKAQAILTERLGDTAITATIDSVTVDTTEGKINLQGSLTVPTAFVQLVGIRNITSHLTSEVTQGSKDIEVAVALDTTGSMAGQKLTDLKNAMNGTATTTGLIDLVVQTAQTPTYSKMAIVPWTQAVNVGSTYAAQVRGTPVPPSTITNAGWMSGTSKSISGVTNANPAVVTTSTNHGFSTGDYVYISGVSGMTNLNGHVYQVGNAAVGGSTKKFELKNVDSRFWSAYSSSSSDKVTECLNSLCQVKITTSTAHGHVAGDTVYISGVNGLTAINGTHAGAVGTVPTSTTYFLTDEDANTVGYTTYSSGGNSYCTKYGCQYLYFQTAAGGFSLYQVNNCATERTTNAFTDTAPTTTKLSYNYASGGADCISQTIQPLTSNKTTLKALVTSLSAANSTAGHLGLAWGWYMISPNFGYLWPAASQPAAYGTANLVKAVILMTDGQFNIQYCNGVLSRDSSNGTSAQKINCDAPDGSSHDQAVAICDAIKAPANDTILYTVGFDLGTDTDSLNFLRDCATTPSDFYRADTGTDLSDAFNDIAHKLNDLRISK